MAQITDSPRAHCEDLGAFVAASPSSFHAAAEIARRLTAQGFDALSETAPWDIRPGGRYLVVRDGAAIAFAIPATSNATQTHPLPLRILGTHTDSPSFKLKPQPSTGSAGFMQAAVEIYGGPLLHTWTDRELELAGRIVTTDGRHYLVRTGPLLRIPNLAVHLDREAMEGLKLDKQRHTQPVWGLGQASQTSKASQADLLAQLATQAQLVTQDHTGHGHSHGHGHGHTSMGQNTGMAQAGHRAPLDPQDIGGYDIVLADTQAGQIFGADGTLFACGRLDNLLSTHAALQALLDYVTNDTGATSGAQATTGGGGNAGTQATASSGSAADTAVVASRAKDSSAGAGATSPAIAMLAAFDHEEVGSASRSGAAGPFLEEVICRIYEAMGYSRSQQAQAMAASVCISSDVGHGVHPNYPDKHDPVTRPQVGGGPILKINANQRYATDAVGAALWNAACQAAGVPSQEFVSNNNSPCGSTIGPITATRLGIRTVDVGVPLLSMHSARELTATCDPWYLRAAMRSVLRGSGVVCGPASSPASGAVSSPASGAVSSTASSAH